MTDNWQNIDFSKQQWNVFQTLINERSNVSNSQNEREFSEFVDTIITDITVEAWNSQKINYFDSFYDSKIVVIEENMKHFDKNIFFRDVHNFIDRIKNMIIIKNDKLIRNNLYICFKNHVLKWWNFIFISKQKRLMKLNENIDEWEIVLFKRWKQSIISVVAIFKEVNYIMKDARKKRESMKYALKIIRAVKTINMSVFSQIILIYIDLKLKFQRDVTKSIEIITMNMCLQELKNNKKLWWNMIFSRHRQNNRFADSNFRFVDVSDSYNNFTYDERQNDMSYSNSAISIMKYSADNNQSSRSTQFSIFYQFQNRIYQSQ